MQQTSEHDIFSSKQIGNKVKNAGFVQFRACVNMPTLCMAINVIVCHFVSCHIVIYSRQFFNYFSFYVEWPI